MYSLSFLYFLVFRTKICVRLGACLEWSSFFQKVWLILYLSVECLVSVAMKWDRFAKQLLLRPNKTIDMTSLKTRSKWVPYRYRLFAVPLLFVLSNI